MLTVRVLSYNAPGFCPICSRTVRFAATTPWFRDDLLCDGCGSLPRERALASCLEEQAAGWRNLRILEAAPANRGISRKMRLEAPAYVGTQYYPNRARAEFDQWGYRNENLEELSFPDNSFDIVVTLDVLEHVNQPAACFAEIARVLVDDGLFLFTVPTDKGRLISERAALYGERGRVEHLLPPEYHGNPISEQGALVTWRYGYDLPDLIAKWSNMDSRVTRRRDARTGILGEFTEVYECRPARRPFSANHQDGLLKRVRRAGRACARRVRAIATRLRVRDQGSTS